MNDQDNQLHYDRLVEEALKGVVKRVLDKTAVDGLPGGHHFYITFRTAYPGVQIPSHLREKHPDEMTIVLQHQFWGLEVDDIGFSVTLTFNKVNERLIIPFAAVSGFTDPSAKFGLQFHVDMDGVNAAEAAATALIEDALERLDESTKDFDDAFAGSDDNDGARTDLAAGDDTGKVVALDAFRKK